MKTVLITGASSGIGAGLAKSFADDGYRVIACGRDAQRLAAVHQHSPNITVRLFDMTDRDACRRALADCAADTVILCAGTCEYLDRGEVDAELVARVMTTNFMGPVNCLAALQPQLVSGNRVVLVSSMAHWLHFPRAEAYGASKAALTRFADTLRLDWEPKGIAVTVVSPGFVDTPLTRKTISRCRAGSAWGRRPRHSSRSGKGKDHIAFPAGFSGAAPAFRPARCTSARTAAQDGATMKIAIIGSGIAGLTCAGGSPDIIRSRCLRRRPPRAAILQR